jgi:hypothetical protein
LLGITSHAALSRDDANHFDCAASRVAYLSNPARSPMFEAIAAFLIVLSAGILIAHALDAYRSWK